MFSCILDLLGTFARVCINDSVLKYSIGLLIKQLGCEYMYNSLMANAETNIVWFGL